MGELYIHNLEPYLAEHNPTIFVETGTGDGTGLAHAAKSKFDKLYSIEIMPQLAEKCRYRFVDDKRVHIIENNSLEGLVEILQVVPAEEPVFFWLDAHFPGADFGFNSYDHLSENVNLHKPLKAELKTIVRCRPDISKDVFIIDDLRIYERGDYELGNWDLYDKYGGGGIEFITKLFSETHDLQKDYRHQGFVILTPKNAS